MLTLLIIVEILLIIILLALLAPVQAKAEGIFSLGTSRGEFAVMLLGITLIRQEFRFTLLEPPYVHFEIISKKKKKPRKLKKKQNYSIQILPLLRQTNFNVQYTVGIKDDAALTVYTLGALTVLTQTVTEALSINCAVCPLAVFDKNILRIKINCIFTSNLANIIKKIKKRGKNYAPRRIDNPDNNVSA